jgi:aldose 1-epimerase
MTTPTLHWLEHAEQRLALCPTVGGSVAAWQWLRDGQPLDLWRPWQDPGHGKGAPDPGDMACYPLVPWSNRIGGGGFNHAGTFYPLQANTHFDPFPIHGDGWQQPWSLQQTGPGSATMALTSCYQCGSPYHYLAEQTFQLAPGVLLQTLSVRNLGKQALPFGVGAHPWFTRTPQCSVQARVHGVWLAGPDKLPTALTHDFPPGWNLNHGVQPTSAVIDNAYADWRGQALLRWPERDLTLQVSAELQAPGAPDRLDAILYTPGDSDVFCFEPVSHPINAAHLPGQPGWITLQPGEEMQLRLRWGFLR